MKVELKRLEVWEQLCQQVKSHLQLNSEVRCYKGLSHALYELTMGLSFFLDYKKSLAWQKGSSYAFDFLLPQFYRMSFQVTHFTQSHLGDLPGLLQSFNKDTLFVLSVMNHPVTAEQFDLEEIDKKLNEKKIYHICVNHHPHLKTTEVRPYTCMVQSIGNHFAFAEVGSRFKAAPQIAPQLEWDFVEVKNVIQNYLLSLSEFKEKVLQFEAELPVGFSPFLQSTKRIYDRAVIFNTAVNAEALVRWLKDNKGVTDSEISTTSPCYWGLIPDYKSWWDGPISEDILRGMILIDARVLGQKIFSSDLQLAVQAVGSL
jgi:hypothetical protein